MTKHTPSVAAFLLFCVCGVPPVHADVLVRWDQPRVPSRESLGISSLLIPAANPEAVREAINRGYNVYVEVEAAQLAGFAPTSERIAGVVVNGAVSEEQLAQVRERLSSPGLRVLGQEERGKWPHIRLNWVTKRNDVLQVSSRTAQPWIENNAALLRIAHAGTPATTPLLRYPWRPITLADADEGPALENYLVAIAETGSFGGDLVLPLHEGFQKALLFGRPAARAGWNEIRRYLEFYAWNLPRQYRAMANVGVVAGEPMTHFEILNLLLRHNLSAEVIAPGSLPGRDFASFQLLIVLDQPGGEQLQSLSEFAQKGGTVVLANTKGPFPWHGGTPLSRTEQQVSYRVGDGRVVEVLGPIVDPNVFALEMRQLLGPDKRLVDIWNGITVLAAPYQEPDGKSVLVSILNYAHEPLPVQLRVRGTFSLVHYETPGQEPVLLPYQHREGYTEFVVPALRIGGRVFLSDEAGF